MRNTVIAFLLGLILIPLPGCSQENIPSDKQLKSALEEHKDSYQKIVDEFLSRGLYRLEVMSNGELNVKPATVDAAELLGIFELLKDELSVDLVSVDFKKDTYDSIREVAFFNYRGGFVFAGEHKGLVYIVNDGATQTTTQLNEIDSQNRELHGRRLYKRLESHWYVFYEYFP